MPVKSEALPVQGLNPFEYLLIEGVRESGVARKSGGWPDSPIFRSDWVDVRLWRFAEAYYTAQNPPDSNAGTTMVLYLVGTMDNYEVDPDTDNWREVDCPMTIRQRFPASGGSDAVHGSNVRQFEDTIINPVTEYPLRYLGIYEEFPYSYVRLKMQQVGTVGAMKAGYDVRVILKGK